MAVAAIRETRQYLTFKLAQEVFAVDVEKVREILELTTITKVPKTPEYMRGVINLRGSVVPVMDLRLKFGMPASERTVDTCIVVVEVLHENDVMVIGALADSVQEVFELEPEQIEPPPQLGINMNADLISGMGKKEGGFIMILNIDKTFAVDELQLASELLEDGH